MKERFESHVHLIPFTTCHIFESESSGGYGQISVNSKMEMSHRVAYELYVGEIPEGLHILHSCDEPACVNPDHLRVGTQQENIDDRTNKDRAAKGENNGRSKLTEADVLEIRAMYPAENKSAIARKYRVSPPTINQIVRRVTWRHLR